jgi:carboxyl-terminal processing protease
VDEVNWDEAYQSATRSVLEKLDPHSVYVSATEVETNEENFQGQYQGIGIQFDIIDGYITVITAVHDSPADKVGLLAGDRIVKIDGKSSIGIDQSEVPRLLKGKSGTPVQVTVLREGISDPLEFKIIRGAIPLYTVTDYFMNADSIGYIYLNRFAKTTEQELDQALTALENQVCSGWSWICAGMPAGCWIRRSRFPRDFYPDTGKSYLPADAYPSSMRNFIPILTDAAKCAIIPWLY